MMKNSNVIKDYSTSIQNFADHFHFLIEPFSYMIKWKRIHLPMDPTQVFRILILFKGVYIQVYRIRLDAPSIAVNPLHPKYKMERPEVLAIKAKLSA